MLSTHTEDGFKNKSGWLLGDIHVPWLNG